jgi:hypothetical protein
MRGAAVAVIFTLDLAVGAAALAAQPWEPGQALDTCLQAVINERPGIVTGWRQAGGGARPPFAVIVLNRGGRMAETSCDPDRPENFQFRDRSGVFRYAMFERATLAESEARMAAPEIFAGTVRLLSMNLAVGFTGRPSYTYEMLLPSGHKATVELDATVIRLIKAEVK